MEVWHLQVTISKRHLKAVVAWTSQRILPSIDVTFLPQVSRSRERWAKGSKQIICLSPPPPFSLSLSLSLSSNSDENWLPQSMVDGWIDGDRFGWGSQSFNQQNGLRRWLLLRFHFYCTRPSWTKYLIISFVKWRILGGLKRWVQNATIVSCTPFSFFFTFYFLEQPKRPSRWIKLRKPWTKVDWFWLKGFHGFEFPSAAPQPPTDCLTAIFGKIDRKSSNHVRAF